MTIIHISNSIGGGGAEQMVYQLSKMSSKDYPTMVISLASDYEMKSRYTSEGISCFFLDINSFGNKSLIHGLQKLHEHIKDAEDLVFHCHQFHAVILGMLYQQLYKSIPIVFTLHSSSISGLVKKIILFMTKPLRSADVIFTKNTKQWFLKSNQIIPNGVDFQYLEMPKKQFNVQQDIFVLLYLGRLSPEKNPLHLIFIAKYLVDHGCSNFRFDVVGDGSLMEVLLQDIKTFNLETHFRVLGFQSDVRSFLNSSHALILTSHIEGMPMVIIEAAAAKLPIVSTPPGSIPEFLNSSNSYLSDLGDIHVSVLNLINNYDKALLKADQLYQETKVDFDISVVYKKHLNLYKSTLNAGNQIN